MEIVWSVRNGGHLHSWSWSSEWPVLVSISLSVEWTSSTWVFSAPVNISWTVIWENIVTISCHVIDDGICVHSDVILSACVYHVSQLFWSTHSWPEPVTCGLIQPIPGVEFSIFWVAEVQDWFLRWEHFDSQVTCLSDHNAFLSDFIVRPSKHFKDGTFLAVFVIWRCIDGRVVPDKVHWI